MAPPVTQQFVSFWKSMAHKVLPNQFSSSSSSDGADLGTIWSGTEASRAYQAKELVSQPGGGSSLRLAFRNLSSVPLLLCWVSEQGSLRHFYRVEPSALVATDPVHGSDKFENTCPGHAFCWIHVPNETDRQAAQDSKEWNPETGTVVGGYRPLLPQPSKKRKRKATPCMQLVTIREDAKESVCCVPPPGGAGTAAGATTNGDAAAASSDDDETSWVVGASLAEVDPTPVPVKGKDHYVKQKLGGWPVYCEPNWHGGDQALIDRLDRDLEAAGKALPPHAREFLQTNCPIWINAKLRFGPAACPITARASCCYHPGKEWLIENGLCPDKHMCVEINSGAAYRQQAGHWEVGGVMIHELSHAYHHGCLPDGYENADVRECYEAAMADGIYNRVAVHGSQGPYARHYACENCMEYFAELSAAFLGGLDETVEFNKWFPFNRKQVREYDPRGYRMLCRAWKIDEQEGRGGDDEETKETDPSF